MTDDCPPDDGAPLPQDPGANTADGPIFDVFAAARDRRRAAMAADPRIEWPVMIEKGPKKDPILVPSKLHIENTQALLDAYGIRARYNLMSHRAELDIPRLNTALERTENTSVAALVSLAERRGLAEKQTLQHMQVISQEYHPVRVWILSKPWDGVDRMNDLAGTIALQPHADAEFSGRLIRVWLVSCVAAVMPEYDEVFTPQGVLTFQGATNIGKTTWFMALQPRGMQWISAGNTLDPHDRDSVQQTTRFWIAELGEVDATFKRSDVAALKAFVTKTIDTYRSAYARLDENVKRRTMLAATVNKAKYLIDPTGNRRWWTVPTASFTRGHTVDMQQLWAQVYELLRQGEVWYLNDAEVERLNGINAGFETPDPLIDDLWSDWEPAEGCRYTVAEIWAGIAGRQYKTRSRTDADILATALDAAGCRNPTRLHGLPTYSVRKRVAAPEPTYHDAYTH